MRRLGGVVSGLLAVGLVAGCTAPASRPAPRPAPAASGHPTASPSRPSAAEIAAREHAAIDRVLHRRAAALRHGDEQGWLADLDPSNHALVRAQSRFYDNLQALPLETFTLHATDATWPSGFAAPRFRRTATIPYVEQRLRLRGFDSGPVTSTFGVTFAHVGGRLRIVSVSDTADREDDRTRSAPWDTTRIVVRRAPHVLGIFDASSQPQADRLMGWTEESLATVQREVPRTWSGSVVVYALSSERLLRRLGTRFLDRAAVAFPVFDDPERPTTRVATRVLINPRDLPQDELQGTYLLTHEITHVALASTNGTTPTWVQEGMADYVATRGADPSRWLPSAATVARARKGAEAMPGSTFFGDDDPGYDYDLSLAACSYLAHRFGQDRLWQFVDRLSRAGRSDGDGEGHVDPVLRSMFHLDSRRLAREAARVVVRRLDAGPAG